MSAHPQLLLTRREVCERLRLSPRTVATLIQRGELPVVRIGRAVRFTPPDLEALVAKRRLERRKHEGRSLGAAPPGDLRSADDRRVES